MFKEEDTKRSEESGYGGRQLVQKFVLIKDERKFEIRKNGGKVGYTGERNRQMADKPASSRRKNVKTDCST